MKACFFQAARWQLPDGTEGPFTRSLSEPGDTRTSKISVVRILTEKIGRLEISRRVPAAIFVCHITAL